MSAYYRAINKHVHVFFQDKSIVEPFPIPLAIVGGKYDIYQVIKASGLVLFFALYFCGITVSSSLRQIRVQ